MGTGPIEKYEGNAATALRERAEHAESEVEHLKSKLSKKGGSGAGNLALQLKGITEQLKIANQKVTALEKSNRELYTGYEKLDEAEVTTDNQSLRILELEDEVKELRAVAGDIDTKDETPTKVTEQAQVEADKIGEPNVPDVTV